MNRRTFFGLLAALPVAALTASRKVAARAINSAYPRGDVRRYGAAGDGITNDAAAFQSAIDDTGDAYVPEGSGPYLISSVIHGRG